jgi:hypothetical protein
MSISVGKCALGFASFAKSFNARETIRGHGISATRSVARRRGS